ncbi:MAG: site-2 protease family protein [Methanomicrobium sp.]|nr:site-2 protease family protein [Methanomicrobium sp.]
MEDSIKIGSLAGVPVRLHITFLLIIPVFSYVIGSDITYTVGLLEAVYGTENLDISLLAAGMTPYLLGGAVTLCLFAAVFLHEMAHCLTAMRYGHRVNEVTLMLLGGISEIDDRGRSTPKSEFWTAISGPLASLFIGILSGAVAYALVRFTALSAESPLPDLILFYIFGYLGILNIFLFLFNMIPAFPMDGGRILRGLLSLKYSRTRATKTASDIGKVFAVIFAVAGIIWLNFLLILIALFVFLGATQENSMTVLSERIKAVKVTDVMNTDVAYVHDTDSLDDVASRLVSQKVTGCPVINDLGHVIGMISIHDIAGRTDTSVMTAGGVISGDIFGVTANATLYDAMLMMSDKEVSVLPVFEGTEIIGLVSSEMILRYSPEFTGTPG